MTCAPLITKCKGCTPLRYLGCAELAACNTTPRRPVAAPCTLSTENSNLQVQYADQSRLADARVTAGIAEYLKEAELPGEIELGRRLQSDWSTYLAVRDEVLGLILEGGTKEAVALDLAKGVPLFERVRQSLDETQRLYDEQASQRLLNVANISRRSVIRLVSVLLCTILTAGVFVWVLQKSRMASTLQFARMQMDFAASVSHELRTPLAVLCSAVDNIADGVVTGKEQLARYASTIRNQSRQINGLVSQVLLFASTQDGKGRYVMRPTNIAEVIESAVVASRTRDEGRLHVGAARHLLPHCRWSSAMPPRFPSACRNHHQRAEVWRKRTLDRDSRCR